MKWHETLTKDRIEDGVQRRLNSLDNPGFCTACGAEADGCEPDAEHYECEACGEHQVFGAEELYFQII